METENRSDWMAEKVENCLKSVVAFQELTRKNIDMEQKMPWGETFGDHVASLGSVIYDLTKLLSKAYGNPSVWKAEDRDLVVKYGEQGIKLLVGKYSGWDFLKENSETKDAG